MPLSERFKEAFRRYPTGVAVISAAGPHGPVGLTASSVASVSVAPPTLSFSLMATRTARVLLQAPSFVVHLLGPKHADLAQDFSHADGRHFTPDQGWRILPSGEPMLPSALAALRVMPLQRISVGDATLVVASVAEVFHGPPDGRLIYHHRNFVISPSSEGI
ncbi:MULTISPECIES: flavin reductase family protein [unclassified Micromonospora]|uniref:flavin reductase family protein n=1 Tax=unclassified Micromonospora TaxID=2617518 RepID=UPI001C24082E|nr:MULTISPECIES: flavin reductase family protein [unclassified Micromonospora]MBU8861793.1 flavin reductase family protein [Micromonospora sp. WMMB482]MDG4800112.1 flavin reductase family protein [Micromonospora sp. WMMD980]MDM4781374.1 flavin reductase family protein [Micromonospora sp. b486]